MPDILLTTLNAKYIHSSFGLRYLLANLGELESRAEIHEFTIHNRPLDIVESLLAAHPRIIGLGVYIWNQEQTTQVVTLLNAIAPEVTIVLGGPEVSYEFDEMPVVKQADYVITGWGETSFAELCQQIFDGTQPAEKIIPGIQSPLTDIHLPYHLYNDDDVTHRIIYVEASRGCPFKCEFCLSSLDKSSWPFDLDQLLDCLEELYSRGARQFKFVDRTFNLKAETSARILDFFLSKPDQMFVHFEVIPDNLPEQLKDRLSKFAPDSLQLEIGIQTFNPEVQALISRRQNNQSIGHTEFQSRQYPSKAPFGG